MIHGGCWQASVADLHIMDWAAADLARRGVAVWNIEYRRIDQPGGGYPGTFQDVAAAVDTLFADAAKHGLEADFPVIVGHSAGGHLALWVAMSERARISGTPFSALPGHRFRGSGGFGAVVDLAGITDLERDTDTACESEPLLKLAPLSLRPDVLLATSPAHMLRPMGGTDIYVIHGAQDVTVRPRIGDAFAAKARAAGRSVTVLNPPGGHVEEIAPGAAAWEQAARIIVERSGIKS